MLWHAKQVLLGGNVALFGHATCLCSAMYAFHANNITKPFFQKICPKLNKKTKFFYKILEKSLEFKL